MSTSKITEVILGVDTHLDIHVGVLINVNGQLLGTLAVETQVSGYLKLLAWARSFGPLLRAGVEGTGTYGAGLAQVLCDHDIAVFEVNRPDRTKRRLEGKSDPTDAESAARSVLSGSATAVAKTHSGAAEAMRAISVVRRSAVKTKTQAINQVRSLLVSAPQEIREQLWDTKPADCVGNCLHLGSLGAAPFLIALATSLRLLARRWTALAAELKELDDMLDSLTQQYAAKIVQSPSQSSVPRYPSKF